ncbi:MAG: hypothetical protein IAC58_04290 [Firmicutes bacterium]|uniref:Uncharacterized protein n=1 Tax=Candidatus Onthovivens merdipullorum TaxID=2840889 RepID=A0A9D9DJT6_9BACL|nr:hypothetical protein [Candidatus Onthovivens merdipullorum]
MSNKLALILCIPFILFVFLFGVDLVMIQTVYTNLDSISETISYKISQNGIDSNGNIDKSIEQYLYETTGAIIVSNNNNKANFLEGDIFAYTLSKEYQPILLSSKTITINIDRYAVIGINHS